MSTSFVEYREKGFWSFDDYLEHLLALLVDRIGSLPEEKWLADLRDHWRIQSSGNFRGWIDLNLDEFLINDSRRDTLLRMLDEIASRSNLTDEMLETANLLARLLSGQLQTDASSPLNYMVNGRNNSSG